MSEPARVAIIGGGCAGVTAAFELTRPELRRKYSVTLYQMGFRLGGKGASGRGPNGRIEEHGLHLWMGYYENAFRLMRDCYSELGRDPRQCPIATWTDAFVPANFNAVMDWTAETGWSPWTIAFPETQGMPGDPAPKQWTVMEYLARAAALLGELLRTLEPTAEPIRSSSHRSGDPETWTTAVISQRLSNVLRLGAVAGLGAAIEATQLLEAALRNLLLLPQSVPYRALEAVDAMLRSTLERTTMQSAGLRRVWEVVDLILASIRGSIRFRLALDPRGFDAIDDYDSREWLRLNGASERSVNSVFLRALYDLAFAYEHGDPLRPRIAAGCALRGAFRAFFTYRGAFFWKMAAGMGDIVFAPLYEVLSRRGVRFEFFHKLTNVALNQPNAGISHVAALDFDVQAIVREGRCYRPLVDIQGIPCWPTNADYNQLEHGNRLRREKRDFESQWDTRHAATRRLTVGRDFDFVVLAVGLGTVPYVCRELLAHNESWRRMVQYVKAVPTQAFQLWLRADRKRLGWDAPPVNLSGFVEPFDTWADMSHLRDREAWENQPSSIAYFCNVMADDDNAPLATFAPTGEYAEIAALEAASTYVRSAHARVQRNAKDFLKQHIAHLWPLACGPDGSFRWELLHTSHAVRHAELAFASQYFTANVRPSDRYSQSLPGSSRHRISPLDPTYDNLTIAGDWTQCGINMGCVEAAVMSGRLAAHAISKSPALHEIIGYDHP